MLSRKVKLFFQSIGIVTVALLTLYGGITAFNNADNLLASVGFLDVASASPILLETQSLNLQTSDAITGTVPPYLNYQGTLRDMNGNPLSGEYNMTFRIYDNILDPVKEPDWTEPAQSVTVRNGNFSVLLGMNNPINNTTIFQSPTTFLGVTVNGFGEMMPRHRFVSVPYAMEAVRSTRLRSPDGTKDAVTVDNDGVVTMLSDKLGDYAFNLLIDGPEGTERAIGFTTDGEINWWFGQDNDTNAPLSKGLSFWSEQAQRWVLSLYENGNVGIGTGHEGASAKLHVKNGDMRVENGTIYYSNAGKELHITTGGAVDIRSPTDDLYLNSRTGGRIHLNPGHGAVVVGGTIHGKMHTSGEYVWTSSNDILSPANPVQMISVANGFCFLTHISGRFNGWGDYGGIIERDGYWWLQGNPELASQALIVKARCVG